MASHPYELAPAAEAIGKNNGSCPARIYLCNEKPHHQKSNLLTTRLTNGGVVFIIKVLYLRRTLKPYKGEKLMQTIAVGEHEINY